MALSLVPRRSAPPEPVPTRMHTPVSGQATRVKPSLTVPRSTGSQFAPPSVERQMPPNGPAITHAPAGSHATPAPTLVLAPSPVAAGNVAASVQVLPPSS